MKQIIAELGAATGATVEAIKKWRLRGKVPPKCHHDILQAAAKRKIPVTYDDFFWKPGATEIAKTTKRQRRAA